MQCWMGRLAAVVAGSAALVSCDNAFKSSRASAPTTASQGFELSFAFDDGSSEATVVTGAVARLELAVPVVGFRRVANAVAGTVDPSRLSISPSVDLGDPQVDGIAAGSNAADRLAADGRLHSSPAADGRTSVVIELDQSALPPFPLGRMVWSVVVLDDVNRGSDPLRVGLTTRAPDRPTASLTLEIPPNAG